MQVHFGEDFRASAWASKSTGPMKGNTAGTLYVPSLIGERAGLCQSALKWKMRDAQNLAGCREVDHYQALTTMIRIHSLAPILPRVFSTTPVFMPDL
jgi:hypothetical protein